MYRQCRDFGIVFTTISAQESYQVNKCMDTIKKITLLVPCKSNQTQWRGLGVTAPDL